MDVAGKLYPTGRIGTTNYILTPENIVNDMINMLPADFWTPDVKVLDIFSKSGRFLMAAYKKLFNSPYLADMDIAKRKRHILSEQLSNTLGRCSTLLLHHCTKAIAVLVMPPRSRCRRLRRTVNAMGGVIRECHCAISRKGELVAYYYPPVKTF